MNQKYPKRLIEVDLPIRRISAHARREKSIRHGHISTLHIWWARRPLAACRAVICASLWPDPADSLCPQTFRDRATKIIFDFASAAVRSKELGESCDHETWIKWQAMAQKGALDSHNEAHWNILRFALLDFIADFANWDNSTVQEYLDTSRALTQAAHEALGGEPGTHPLVVDPFAGGGSIPLEALRVGADAFASDLNPIPVLLNRVILEYIPKYGQRLAEEARKWGERVKQEAEKELGAFYPKDSNGATPIAYLWARTIRCEGPGCGSEVPLIRSPWLARKSNRSIAVELLPDHQSKTVTFRLITKDRVGWKDASDAVQVENPKLVGTMKRGSVTCPCCGYTTPVSRVRDQLRGRHGGTKDAVMFAVVTVSDNGDGRNFRLPTSSDLEIARNAALALEARKGIDEDGSLSFVPSESTESYHSFVNRGPIYGMTSWEDYYTPRQLLVLGTLARLVAALSAYEISPQDIAFGNAVKTILGLGVSRLSDICNAFCMWETSKTQVRHLFTKQMIPMMWDFAETCVFSKTAGDFMVTVGSMVRFLESQSQVVSVGQSIQASACAHPLPSGSVSAAFTDPPYYYSVQYADASDFFYIWLKRALGAVSPDLFSEPQTPKSEEIIVQSPAHQFASEGKNNAHYQSLMRQAMAEIYRVIAPSGVCVVVFAHTSASGWESLLGAMIEAGWIVTGSWPIDTELANRLISLDRSVLASSVHLVCRPRAMGLQAANESIGDWRDVLAELPKRIHDWMPRLAAEGVVGADAIFACLGPALEVFSRYSHVEKANGDTVTLREYLEHVWAAVAREALEQVFKGADATGFEPDARLTAIWLWTLNAPSVNGKAEDNGEDDADDEEQETKKPKAGGFRLEYDAARKIAQGLGAALENSTHLVEVKGDEARLLPVAERTLHLFGKDQEEAARPARKKASAQMNMFAELTGAEDTEAAWQEKTVTRLGETTLDRVHQAMILFAAGRGDALKRFAVDDGVGRDGKFWRLAQALSALYPSGTEERRWVEGVMARKKQFGF